MTPMIQEKSLRAQLASEKARLMPFERGHLIRKTASPV